MVKSIFLEIAQKMFYRNSRNSYSSEIGGMLKMSALQNNCFSIGVRIKIQVCCHIIKEFVFSKNACFYPGTL